MKKAILWAHDKSTEGVYLSRLPVDEFIQSLQQPTEIEVRIAMGCSLPNGCTEPEIECTCEPTYNLDENGCLTLWVLNT